jgi:hypothetical protein
MTILNYPVKRSALAKAYRISDRTFITWLRDIGIDHTRTLSPAELKKIVQHYDLPSDVQVRV